ncbi:MAG: PD-(D/E)XK nuclease family protein, partial [Anaerolineales bacterium]|nr:PD-(D/E)XK nuclease family protein [Anaerolineales bacterium]
MTARLLLAPAAHGKTQSAIRRIQEILAAEPLAGITVILPNQLRVSEFRRRLAATGGALGVNLVTFHSLYADILAHAGQPRPRLLDPLQVRLLRAIVDRLCQEGRLVHYAPLRTSPGFITALRTIIEELKRARIEPDDFAAAIGGMGANLAEIASVYRAYQDWLLAQDWVDPEGQGWLAGLALAADPQLECNLRLLVVNGFDEFNPTQLGVLALLAERAAETIITLTGDPERPNRLAHRRFQRARQALSAAIDLTPSYLSSTSITPNPIETGLFELTGQRAGQPAQHLPGNAPDHPVPPNALQPPDFIEAQNRASESRAALRWIKTQLVHNRFELSEVAILARNLAPYQPYLEETAAEFGMPLRLLGGLALAENPAVAALLSLLSIPALDWPRRPVLATWRSPYFDWTAENISPSDAAALDAATRLGRVRAGFSQWQEAFDLWVSQATTNTDAGEEEDGFSSPLPPKAGTGLREKFNAFVARITPPARGTLHDYAAFVEDLMGDDPALATRFTSLEDDNSLQMVARARENPTTTERDLAALSAFKDTLRGLVLSEAVLESTALDYADFFAELRGAVEAATYSAAPESGVLVASVLAARGLSFRAVAILGLSEGEFPRLEREDPFLSEADRATLRRRGLPIESKLHGDEATFFYQAVTRASEQLLLCRPYLADDGQNWQPSPYWLNVWRMFGQPAPQRVRPEDPLPPEQAASPVEYAQACQDFDANIQHGSAILQTRLLKAEVDPATGELAEALTRRYAASFGWSASKLESYGTCPFFFYIAHALGLQARTPPEEGYDARILGSMLHQILEYTYSHAPDPTDLAGCLQLMPVIARQVFEAAPASYGFRPTPLWQRQQDELIMILKQTLTALAEVSQGYTPK